MLALSDLTVRFTAGSEEIEMDADSAIIWSSQLAMEAPVVEEEDYEAGNLPAASDKNIRFGTEDFSADEIDMLAAQLLATDVGTAVEADYQARRFVEEMFAGADPWKNIYALWHWCGGIRATAADLWSVLSVIEANSGDVIYRLTPNWSEHESLLSSITDSIYDAMSAGAGFEEPAKALAALLTSLCERASVFVGFDEGTSSWEDSNNLLPLIDTWMSLADCLMEGPDAEGRYLPDESVYGVLAGAEPQIR